MAPKPGDVPCPGCDARPGDLCTNPRGHQTPWMGYHATRRAESGLNDGPLHPPPKRYIKTGLFTHGCGEPIQIEHDGRCTARGGTVRCSWDEGKCPRCYKTVWIEDLGPEKHANNSLHKAATLEAPKETEQPTLL